MPRRPTPPKYAKHSSGQARVRIDGNVHYLGAYGSPESYQLYAKLICDWQARQSDSPRNLTIAQLAVLYMQHASTYYVKNGKPTGHLHIVRNGLRCLNQLYQSIPVAEFDAKKLTILRTQLIERGLARAYINDLISVVKRMFKWAVPEKLAPVTVHHELTTVGTLKAGRSAAREPRPIRAVPDARIDALKPHVPPAVWVMIQLQRLTRISHQKIERAPLLLRKVL